MTGLVKTDLCVARGGREIIPSFSLDLPRGQLAALIGPNGSGKSTLLQAVLGYLPARLGEVRLDGDVISGRPPHALSGRIAYLPQTREINWPIVVYDMVMLGRLPHQNHFRTISSHDRAAVERAIALCGLEGFESRALNALSGGEQARALLARALATEADWLFVDEPTTSLDPYHQLAIMEVLQGQALQGRGVIAVLHDLSLASQFANSVFMMHEGALLASGSASEVLSDENLARAFSICVARGEGGELFPQSRI